MEFNLHTTHIIFSSSQGVQGRPYLYSSHLLEGKHGDLHHYLIKALLKSNASEITFRIFEDLECMNRIYM